MTIDRDDNNAVRLKYSSYDVPELLYLNKSRFPSLQVKKLNNDSSNVVNVRTVTYEVLDFWDILVF